MTDTHLDDRSPPLPEHFGDYRVIALLGEGGMGAVYEAEQRSPRRGVALKVIRPELASGEFVRRFEREATVLARLQHPGIAQIHEAGTFESPGGGRRPFFAMELVRGVPLTRYAADHALDVRGRLELVVKICDAVQHAHQRGIIHRDLKPANILVDETGQPKILDFGVARLTDSDVQATMQTDAGQLVGTLPYMSPEQAAGDPDDLDTRSDVYAIGVVCYELLSGRLPHDLRKRMLHEAVRVIREEEPLRLSSIDRSLRGDVETIVAKALEKERSRRYQSAGELGTDIQRFLLDKEIAARPASTWYRLAKFSRRHKGLVSGLAAAFVLLAAGLVGTSLALARALRAEADLGTQLQATEAARKSESKERARAEAQRDKAEKMADFMSETLRGVGPSVALGRDVSMLKEMMDLAAERIEKGDLTGAPEAELRLRGTIGDTYRQLALFPQAARILEPAVEKARALHAGDHEDTANALCSWAALLQVRGDLAEAEARTREALEMWSRLAPGDSQVTARELLHLGQVLGDRGDLASAEARMHESLEMTERLRPGDHPDAAASLDGLASALQARGDLAGAETLARRSLEMQERLVSGDHPSLAVQIGNLAQLLHSRGDLDGAEPLYRRSIEMKKRLYSGDSPTLARGYSNLADLIRIRGDLPEAEAFLRESLAMWRRLFPGDHPDVATTLNNLGLLRERRGDEEEAERLCKESLAMRRRLFPGDHPDVAIGINSVSFLYQYRGDLASAEPLCRESLEMTRRLYPGDHPDVAIGLHNLAFLLDRAGDLAGARSHYRESLEMTRRLYPGDHSHVAQILQNQGSLLRRMGDLAGAERALREALEMRRRILPGDNEEVAISLDDLGRLLQARGDLEAAEELLRESLEMSRRLIAGDDGEVAVSLEHLASVLVDGGDLDEAETLYREALAMRRRLSPRDDQQVAASLDALARLLLKRSDAASAEPIAREAVALFERLGGRDAASIARCRSTLGEILAALERFAEAETELVASERVLAAAPNVPDGRHRRCVEALAALYAAWDEADPGRGHGERAASWRAKIPAAK